MNERDLRTLLVRATEDRPAGIDLMPAIAPRPRRILVPSLVALGAAALVTVIVTALPAGQVSAQAQVAAALRTTSGESFRVHVESDGRRWDGAFDPVRRTGVIAEAGDPSETRFVGDLMYQKPAGAAKWEALPRVDERLRNAPPTAALVKLAPQDPQAALERLRAATDVREDGAASGPGWSGRRFVFTLTDESGSGEAKFRSSALSGRVDVDDEGRVRRLEFDFPEGGHRLVMDIAGFGTPVSVTAPPAGEVVPGPVDASGGAKSEPAPDLKGRDAKPAAAKS
ncbi:hypothetical protein [Microbispora amethystogenes]|uniref:Outer membrane lipoprotein carrier protein LolA n=1 Tax=Microbispora amethystogenes TaxID=1427754 RepID=A0ABQ4F538_9ACTN|nr:hypothetical protein [Microbispora amethystogenes]GIH29926.1 hypothetical protein Mam01_00900 [Microbispora amethystogenes]